MRIYIGNLSYSSTDESLRQLFCQHGQVESASVIIDRETGRSRGFGFVEMSSENEGRAAIAALNGQDFEGRSLNVNEARAREPRHSGASGSRRPTW